MLGPGLHEGAGERACERVGGPCQREGAGLFGGGADNDAVAQTVGDDGRSRLGRRSAVRRIGEPRLIGVARGETQS